MERADNGMGRRDEPRLVHSPERLGGVEIDRTDEAMEAVMLEIALLPVSWVFSKGSRLRLAIAAADAERLAGRLAKDPALIARLLNRDLDPAVLKQAAALDIKIFPSRWSDLKMRCSCPDWAVPCKHLAAVIYLLITATFVTLWRQSERWLSPHVLAMEKRGRK